MTKINKTEKLTEPLVINLFTNPQEFGEVQTVKSPQFATGFLKNKNTGDSIALVETQKIVDTFNQSLHRYPLIPQYATDPYIPDYK